MVRRKVSVHWGRVCCHGHRPPISVASRPKFCRGTALCQSRSPKKSPKECLSKTSGWMGVAVLSNNTILLPIQEDPVAGLAILGLAWLPQGSLTGEFVHRFFGPTGSAIIFFTACTCGILEELHARDLPRGHHVPQDLCLPTIPSSLSVKHLRDLMSGPLGSRIALFRQRRETFSWTSSRRSSFSSERSWYPGSAWPPRTSPCGSRSPSTNTPSNARS